MFASSRPLWRFGSEPAYEGRSEQLFNRSAIVVGEGPALALSCPHPIENKELLFALSACPSKEHLPIFNSP